MLSIQKIIFICGLMLLASVAYATDEYFYAGSEREILLTDSTKCLIKFSQEIPPESRDSILTEIDGIEGTVQNAQILDDFFACSLSVGIDYAELMATLAGTEGFIALTHSISWTIAWTLSWDKLFAVNFSITSQQEQSTA